MNFTIIGVIFSTVTGIVAILFGIANYLRENKKVAKTEQAEIIEAAKIATKIESDIDYIKKELLDIKFLHNKLIESIIEDKKPHT